MHNRLQEPRPHLGDPRPGLQARAERRYRQGRRRSPQRKGHRPGAGRQVIPHHQVLRQGQQRADRVRRRPLRGGLHFFPEREGRHPPRRRRRSRRSRRHHRGAERDRRGVPGQLGEGRQEGEGGRGQGRRQVQGLLRQGLREARGQRGLRREGDCSPRGHVEEGWFGA